MGRERSTSVYVGNLPSDFRSRDLESLFEKYGRIKHVDLKARPSRGPPFAFVEYDDPRDAEDAIRGRDGYDVDGCRLRVELTRGSGPRGFGGRPLNDSGRSGGHSRSSRRRGYPVFVSGLPPSGSWQDLKDHMREAGEVVYADVNRDGTGVVEFARSDDAKAAIRDLDDTKFKSHEGETTYIRCEGSRGSGSRSRTRSRSPRDRRSNRRSPTYSRSRSRSRSKSPVSPRGERSPRSRSRSFD
ncbi:hypothetical protein M3Y94_00739300 [Aphelenchoides besseyi]|nr:hypothetical protein M3Y94_00739300 [Aphelenchoides besseyi]KAI6231966.1 hypothetical protein M3Y95_00437200 [Aphelenchoides besseyi]